MTTLSSLHKGIGRAIFPGLFGLLLSFAPTVQASPTIVIADLDNADANTITYQDNSLLTTLVVGEDYRENYYKPYPSHGGYAVVNGSGQYFDKILTYTGAASGVTSTLQFLVTNNTPSSWSDYHIELWDSGFSTKLASSVIPLTANDQFISSQNVDGVVSFWAPGSHDVMETGSYSIAADLYAINGAADGSIGIRQVATVPEPGTFALLSFGLAGLLGYRRSKAVA
ncbi:MAG: PEP-CTERM sorting domain-containing protein [Chlorobiaceae bacterium]|nr:PEP-CTERM sorting domain-containing protein [Chlorobiaceae bacterium]